MICALFLGRCPPRVYYTIREGEPPHFVTATAQTRQNKCRRAHMRNDARVAVYCEGKPSKPPVLYFSDERARNRSAMYHTR